ncbi:MAG: zf-HC2 domain-containing protein [Desulfomonile tiedjei]|nr:zf-HC2 domain-containing protein [Desulfomonile tiedjei]
MTDSVPSCSEGWDPAELLAYLEGDLAPEVRAELETHLRTCEVCAAELKSLRSMDSLLRHRTLAFHPDEEALHRFVISGEDRDGKITAHLASCHACAEDVELLREMARLGTEVAEPQPTIPAGLVRQIERLHPTQKPESLPTRVVASLREFFAFPFRLPMFALGTAAAAVILIVVLIPRQEVPVVTPQSAPEQLAEHPGAAAERKAAIPGRDAVRQVMPYGGGVPYPGGMPPLQGMPYSKDKETDSARDRVAAPPQAPQKPAAPAAEADKPGELMGTGAKPDERAAPQEAAPSSAKKYESVPQERRALARRAEPQAPAASTPARQEPAKTPEVATARKKAGATPSLGASVEKEAAAPPGRLREGVDTRIPVTLRVVDADGREVSWIRPALPPGLESRYRLAQTQDEEKPPAAAGESAPGKAGGLGFADTANPAIPLLIQLHQRGDIFDLDAKRLDPSSGRETKRVEAIGVARADLQDRILSLVASLLD